MNTDTMDTNGHDCSGPYVSRRVCGATSAAKRRTEGETPNFTNPRAIPAVCEFGVSLPCRAASPAGWSHPCHAFFFFVFPRLSLRRAGEVAAFGAGIAERRGRPGWKAFPESH